MENKSGVRKTLYVNLAKAREAKEVTVLGKYIRISDASDSNAVVQIAIGENIPSKYETLKKNGRVRDGDGFKTIYIKNEAQADKWMRIIISDGEFDYDVENPSLGVIDSIGSIEGVVDVDFGVDVFDIEGDDHLGVYDPNAKAAVELLDGTQVGLQRGLITLQGASYAIANNSSETLVTAAANTNGVIIRRADLVTYSATLYSQVTVDGDPINLKSLMSERSWQTIENYFIPAGTEVVLYSSAANYSGQAWYEVL